MLIKECTGKVNGKVCGSKKFRVQETYWYDAELIETSEVEVPDLFIETNNGDGGFENIICSKCSKEYGADFENLEW